MRGPKIRTMVAAVFLLGAPSTAWSAAQEGGPPGRLQVKPLLDARLRYEKVDQPSRDAEAFTFRLRTGAEARLGSFSLLAEAETTLALIDEYNAFPFAGVGQSQAKAARAIVADPENIEVNRLQLGYRSEGMAITLGRQRINLDDQRWVGSVGWRQNEQTFDALRGEAEVGPARIDLTFSIGQRTVFGREAASRAGYDGNFIFAGLSSMAGPVQGKLFAYLLDYDEEFLLANSSQTYGGAVTATLPLGGRLLNLRLSYARQSDYGSNSFDYAADYWAVEGGTSFAGFVVTGGWERLGSDNGRSVQTPMATLHKFNGWADMFLTTPATGLEDAYLSISRTFPEIDAIPGLSATLAIHEFDSAAGKVDFGTEYDASIGFKFGRIAILAKYANYQASGFGVDSRKLWLQAEFAY